MKLFYRGVSYDYDVATGAPLRAAAPVRQPFSLSYRGLAYDVNPAQATRSEPVHSAALLVYRGLTYSLNGGQVAIAPVKPAINFKLFTTKAAAMAEVSNLHRSNIYQRLERRLKAAEAKGDQSLVQQLHREMEQTV
jgi:Domain of unknown function (DUF4278)